MDNKIQMGLTKEDISEFFAHCEKICRQCHYGRFGPASCDRRLLCLIFPIRNYASLIHDRPKILDAFVLREIEPEAPKQILRKSFPRAI
jgi:hypothetical protein